MEKANLVLLTLITVFIAGAIDAQNPQPALDKYLETAKTIVIAKCLTVGPVNIMLRADVEVEILMVVKGKETLRRITVDSHFEMVPDANYLLRTENEATADGKYFRVNTRDSAIRLPPYEDMTELRALSPRIIVLRTMNLRIIDLESEIRLRNYELEALKAARLENPID